MRRIAVLCILSAVCGAVAAVVLISPPQALRTTSAQELSRTPPASGGNSSHGPGPNEAEDLTPEERVNVAVYERVNRSVVHITTSVRAEALFLIELSAEGEGSGAVLDQEGHLLTNYHVIEGARDIQVMLFDGNSYPAREVGHDAVTDVAVLKIDAPADSLHPVAFGDTTRLRVGQRVLAIGNPFGLERTLTTGIISSLNRSLPSRSKSRTIKQVIQVDAAINPGSSGGPLLDTRGRMIGMNTAIASKTGDSAGVGFAIPANTIARVVPQLIRDGRVIRPDIGIARVYQTERGLLIATLVPGGPAERAGLRGPKIARQRKRQGPFVYEHQTVDRAAADLIVGVDGQPIKNADDFLGIIEGKQPGDEVALNLVREGREASVRVRLGTEE